MKNQNSIPQPIDTQSSNQVSVPQIQVPHEQLNSVPIPVSENQVPTSNGLLSVSNPNYLQIWSNPDAYQPYAWYVETV